MRVTFELQVYQNKLTKLSLKLNHHFQIQLAKIVKHFVGERRSQVGTAQLKDKSNILLRMKNYHCDVNNKGWGIISTASLVNDSRIWLIKKQQTSKTYFNLQFFDYHILFILFLLFFPLCPWVAGCKEIKDQIPKISVIIIISPLFWFFKRIFNVLWG